MKKLNSINIIIGLIIMAGGILTIMGKESLGIIIAWTAIIIGEFIKLIIRKKKEK